MKTIIHVNRQLIAYNRLTGAELPVYTIKRGKQTTYGFGVEIKGPSQMVDPRHTAPLPCGARAWIETEAPVIIEGAMSWAEVQRRKDAHDFKAPSKVGAGSRDVRVRRRNQGGSGLRPPSKE